MTPKGLARLHAAAMTDTRPWSAAEFAALLAQPGVFPATTPHAFALGRVVLDVVELLTLATDPAHRRQGHGRRVLADFHHQARERGAITAFLEVDSENAAAIALYEAEGYRKAGRRRGYYTHPGRPATDAIVMTFDLPGRV